MLASKQSAASRHQYPMTPSYTIDVLQQLVRRHVRPLAVMALAVAFLVLSPSWYMMEVYDRVINSRNLVTLGMLTLAVLLLIALLEMVEWWRGERLAVVARAWDKAMAQPVFLRAFQSAQAANGSQNGQQAMGHLQSVRTFIVSPALTGLIDTPLALLFLGLLWAIHPLLALVALLAAAVQAFSAWRLHLRSGELTQRAQQWGHATQSYAERMLRQSPTLSALGMWPTVFRRWQELHGKSLQQQVQLLQHVVGHQVFGRWLQQAVGSALLGVACWLLLGQALAGGPGMLIVASILGGRVVAPLFQVVMHWNQVAQARTAVSNLSDLLGAGPAPDDALPLPPPKGSLVVEQLVVGSPVRGAAPLLKGLSFRLQPGEMLAVLGNSGAGKTTLARALLGLLSPAAGSVRLDGVDIAGWDRREIGPRLGYLPQQVELLDGTLADNIARFGVPDEPMLNAAVTAAGLQGIVAEWPGGLSTDLGEGGLWLSGGVRQRVGLARALYGDPALLVLDEPNASLDREGDAALHSAISAHKARGRTVVVVSHRSEVIQLADHLLVLRDGQQVAFGPRDEVLTALRKAQAAATAPAPAAPAHTTPSPASGVTTPVAVQAAQP